MEIFMLFILCHCLLSAEAAKRVDAHTRATETLKRRRSDDSILQRREETPLDAKELFQLTEGESLEGVYETRDAGGTRTEKLTETYNGIEVYDTVVTVRKDDNGQLTGEATGVLIQEIEQDLPDTEAVLTDEETLEIALREEGDDIDEVANVNYTREIYVDDNDKARLVNVLSYLIDGVKRPFYIIDVRNGEILKHWEGLNSKSCRETNYKVTGGNERMGRIPYGEKPYCLNFNVDKGRCFLENKYVRIIDMKNENHSNYRDLETASFDCEEGYNDEANGGYSPAIDAFFYGSVVGRMFKEWFDSKPLKNKMILRVHYGYFFQNAYWDGLSCTFGDGADYLYPLTSLDLIGHEIGHGVTEQGSRLVYTGESGGVDEAFSDIIGEAAEDFIKISDFMTGHSIVKEAKYLREFEHPENDEMSISHVSDMKENMDPHLSSGVYRRVFYVAVKEGIPIRYVTEVFLHANRLFWRRTSSFYECSCGVLKAALDLGYDTVPFRKAFKDVGIERCDVSKYVFILKNRKTRPGIEVFKLVNPVFKLEIPPWADELNVKVESEDDIQIKINAMSGGWEDFEDTNTELNHVANGINDVTTNGVEDTELFIKLSLDNASQMEDDERVYVDITASYTCKSGYVAQSDEAAQYKRDCKRRKSSKKKAG